MPPRTARRHRQGEESRALILDAALEIAAERGYSGTTMSLVTERTGLPSSSIYWHFRNKDHLLAEALDHSWSRWLEAEPRTDPDVGDDLESRVAQRMERLRTTIATAPEFWRLGLMLGLLRTTDEIAARDRFLALRRATIESTERWWADALPVGADGGAPRVLARLQLAAADGLLLASETDRVWSYPRLTHALGRALPPVALRLAGSPTRPTASAARPGRSVPLSALPDDSRSRLLRAAAEVSAERGYVGTSISRICERSGLPPSSLYWFFADKDALLAEVLERSFDEWLDRQPTWTLATTPEQRVATLKVVLRSTIGGFHEAPDFLLVGHLIALETRDEGTTARARFLAIRRQAEKTLTAWFAGTLARGPAAADRDLHRTLARLTMAVTDGLFLGEQMDEWETDPDDVADALVALLEEIVGQRESELAPGPSARRRDRRGSASG